MGYFPAFPTAAALATFACVCAGNAQTPPPKFDVASVKLDPTGIRVGFNVAVRGGPGTSDPGLFSISHGQPLKMLIARAYDMPIDQIFGPSWLDDVPGNLYAIAATMPPDTSKERFLLMWQNLLVERFHLALHHETRDFPGYDLVVASGGPKVKPWVVDPNAEPLATDNPGTDDRGFPRLRPDQAVGFNIARHDGSMSFLGTYKQSMADFARGLGQMLRQAGVMPADGQLARVLDKTGLSGVYGFKFQYEGTLGGGNSNADTPSIFTELQAQLGLKLVKSKGVPVDVLVIDHADKTPTEN